MIVNHNGTAELALEKDGGKTAVIYRTVNDEVIVVKAGSVGDALAGMADEISGFPLQFEYPPELELEGTVSEKNTVSVERYEEPASPELDFDDAPEPPI